MVVQTTFSSDREEYQVLQNSRIEFRHLSNATLDMIRHLEGPSGVTLEYEAKSLGLRTDTEGLKHLTCATGHVLGVFHTLALTQLAMDKEEYNPRDLLNFDDVPRRLRYLRKIDALGRSQKASGDFPEEPKEMYYTIPGSFASSRNEYDRLSGSPIEIRHLKHATRRLINTCPQKANVALDYEAKKLGFRSDMVALKHYVCARGCKL
jgi:hypothetical protein